MSIVEGICGSKLIVKEYTWQNNFSHARNSALEFAKERYATWAVTIDTDERLVFSEVMSRDKVLELLSSDASVAAWMLTSADLTYSKKRFIRLPTDLVWSGTTHEALTGKSLATRKVLPRCHFWEERKTSQEMREKLTRDLLILLAETNTNPSNPRWWYFLGQTYGGLGLYKHAEAAFRECVSLDGWMEQRAFAYYLLAKSLSDQGLYDDAILECGIGAAICGCSAELAWINAWCHYKKERYQQAISWSAIAGNLGYANVSSSDAPIFFRNPVARFEGPYDILRFALKQIGEHERAAEAEIEFNKARTAREAACSTSVSR